MKILVLDDDQDVLEYLKVLFEKLGHEIRSTTDTKEFFKTLTVFLPDLILLDVVLPDKNGFDILREIKQLDSEVSVVMITAYQDADKITEAFELDVVDYLFKPFEVEYIQDKLLPRIRPRRSN